jgi:plastocyanin
VTVSIFLKARRFLWVSALAGSVAGCSAPQQTAPATESLRSASPAETPRANRGRIRGLVSLRGGAPAHRSEPIAKDQNVCGSTASVTRIALGKDDTVRGAFVYLDGISTSEPVRPRLSTQVEQKGCEYGPHVMTLAAGGSLEIVNNDPILHNVHARQAAADGLQTVFNIAQPIRGQRTKVDAPLDKPGIVALTCEAGHPWMTAYIFVANHPFVATSGDNGEFVIDDVPAGTYPIRMWHEGVQLSRVIPSMQVYEYEEPYEATEQVVVPANGEAVVNFSFELRPMANGAKTN